MTDSDPNPILEELMRENGLTAETRLYRATLPDFLAPTDAPESFRLSANAQPSEAVVDIYAGGHVCLAEQVGAGIHRVPGGDHFLVGREAEVADRVVRFLGEVY